eukprot:3497796-Pleurochrysis_carterae.AAC.1
MCLPWLRRFRECRSLRRAERVATRARGLEEICRSTQVVRDLFSASRRVSGDSSGAGDCGGCGDAGVTGSSWAGVRETEGTTRSCDL